MLPKPSCRFLFIFFLGREAWNFCESKLIPKNSIEVLGPAVLSWARGIPSSEKTFWVVKRCAAGMESGGEMIKNHLKDGPDRVCRNCLRGSNKLLLITCRKF